MTPPERTASVSAEEREAQDLEERARPFRALYEHWERNQWSPLDIDYSVDATSFAALDEDEQSGFIWIFSHRYHAEFKVATILAPFVMRAPSYETQVVLSTQLADEFRHMQSVLRVYERVFGITSIDEIQALADANLDVIASSLYDALEGYVKPLETTADPDVFLKATMAYHIVAEGVVARTAQNLTAGQYARFGAFPGLVLAQQRVGRDEARHIGFGVSYIRWRMADDPEHAREVVEEFVDEFTGLAAGLLQTAISDGMDSQVLAGYGVDAQEFYAEAMRFWNLRLRSIGYLEDED
jgi:ribonucleotide reductase beta subunit family protein with ferritin-like domain